MASLLKNNTNTINDLLTTINNLPNAITIDTTLTQSGKAADAKAVGDALDNVLPITSTPVNDVDIWIDPDDNSVESSHINDKNNPHYVTAKQIGAASAVHTHKIADVSGVNTLKSEVITDALTALATADPTNATAAAVEQVKGRTTNLESQYDTLYEDYEVVNLNLDAIEEEIGELELALIKNFSLAPFNVYNNPIDYRFLIGDRPYTIDSLVLNQMPIVSVYQKEFFTLYNGTQNCAIRKMPNIPVSVLASPIDFVADNMEMEGYQVKKSTVVIKQENQYVKSYTHTVTFGTSQAIETELVFLEVSQPYSTTEDEHYSFFNESGIYYVDKPSTDFYMATLNTDSDPELTVIPNIKMLFSEPITIPAKDKILTAPNGNKYRLTVDNNGNLSTTAVE